MGDIGTDFSAQLSLGVNVTLVRVMCGSPAGMGQLIKYFESQSRRLDRQQSAPSQLPSLNSDFESLIKFNGVPILPPAMTVSRREELRQLKKDAILLEKRQRARQRKQLLAKMDCLVGESQASVLEPSPRPTARQLNFDSGAAPWEDSKSRNFQERFGATNPLSTFATAESELPLDDFGLHTMDSVNSDFMSLEEGCAPTVFNGMVLTSFKEQKISYDLDRLVKGLKIQDDNFTSSSEMSDTLTQTQEDKTFGQAWMERMEAQRAARGGDVQSASFFHESQDTVVEVSQDMGEEDLQDQDEDVCENSSTSGFVDSAASANLEQTQTSVGSSPGCGSNVTVGTVDSQRSNRSSPKSLKNAVHFASFVTEYINTSASQSFESTTIVKKKMSADMSATPIHTEGEVGDVSVVPIIGDPSEARQRQGATRKLSDEEGGLLSRVTFNTDSDSSATTPPWEPKADVPFLSYGRGDTYNSDKENECSQPQSHKVSHSQSKRDVANHGRMQSGDSPLDTAHDGPTGRMGTGGEASSLQVTLHEKSRRLRDKPQSSSIPQSAITSGNGVPDSSMLSVPALVGTSQTSSLSSMDLLSASQVIVDISTGVDTISKPLVSESQGSNKSSALTATSGSSDSTVKEEMASRSSGALTMNIIASGSGTVHLDSNSNENIPVEKVSSGKEEKVVTKSSKSAPDQEMDRHSPKKLNIDSSSGKDAEPEENKSPPRSFVRRGSYTLSEPSPALLRAKSHLEADSEKEPSHNSQSEGKVLDKHNVDKSADLIQQKLNFDPADETESNIALNLPISSELEQEGKTEHMNKYLNQVQFQNSMNLSVQSWDQVPQEGNASVVREKTGEEVDEDEDEPSSEANNSLLDVLRSLAESHGSLDQVAQLSAEDLLALHQQQMEQSRRSLMEQQQKEMEELFVQQRREVMMLEGEIKAAQLRQKEHQSFLIDNAPENIKIKARNHPEEYSPENSGNYSQQRRSAIQESMNSLDNMRPQSYNRSSSGDVAFVPGLNLQPKSYPQMNPNQSKPGKGRISKSKTQIQVKKVNADIDPMQTYVKTVADDSFSPRPTPPQDVVARGNRVPDFSPSSSSPRIHRAPVLRSPLKHSALQKRDGKVVLPAEAHLPEMQVKFERVSAVAKGFLTRCLLRSDKVQELVKTIKDTRDFAFNFQTETPIKKGVFTSQDRALLERIVAQLQAALLDIHEIFFEIPSSERMALIEQTRLKGKASKESVRGSGPRISQATLKALERKRKAQEAEASAMLSVSPRPRTAPSTSSPRCQNHTDIRALKPIQSQGHAHVGQSENRGSEKERPRTAPEKQLTRPKRISATSSKSLVDNKDSNKEAGNKVNVTTSKVSVKSKVAPSKPAVSRNTKSWR